MQQMREIDDSKSFVLFAFRTKTSVAVYVYLLLLTAEFASSVMGPVGHS
jgi:hypothetical protein